MWPILQAERWRPSELPQLLLGVLLECGSPSSQSPGMVE